MVSENDSSPRSQHNPWNKGRIIGQKRPLKPRDVWTIRVRLQLERRKRHLALFNLAIDSKLTAVPGGRQVEVSAVNAGARDDWLP